MLSARRATSAVRNQGDAGFGSQNAGDFAHVRLDRLDPRPGVGEGAYVATWAITLWRSWPVLDNNAVVDIAAVDAISSQLLDDALYLTAGLRHVRDEGWLMPPTMTDPRSGDVEIGGLVRVPPQGGRCGWQLTVQHFTAAATVLDDCPASVY